MEKTWKQNVLLVTNDHEVKDRVSSTFGKETILDVVSTSEEAIEHLSNSLVNVVIIDAKTTDVKAHYSDDKEIISFLEIVQFANHIGQNIPIVVLVNALLSKEGSFAAKSGATLIMDRKDISTNRLIYVLRVLRKRTFRTLLARDLTLGASYPVDIYHYLPTNRRYLPFLTAETPFTQEKKERISASGTRHLYVKEVELPDLLRSLKEINPEPLFSDELATIHSRYRKLIIDFLNISTDGALHYGKILLENGIEIVERIEKLIARYPDPITCLKELPYPRWSDLAHGINSAIYALVFARASGLQSPQEIAFAALIHNIGMAEINQNILMKPESEMTSEEFEEYKKHVSKSLEIFQRKKILLSPLVEKTVAQHHENFDGTGFPERLAGTYLALEPALLSLLGCFDYFNTVRDGEKSRSITEVWECVMAHHTEATALKKKFHPALMEKLGEFFYSNYSAP